MVQLPEGSFDDPDLLAKQMPGALTLYSPALSSTPPATSTANAPSTPIITNTLTAHPVAYNSLTPPEYEQFQASSKQIKSLSDGVLSVKKQTLTILLVGETGVGKTAILDLFTNVLGGLEPTTYRTSHIAANRGAQS
jgi:hypothetical protein